VGEFFLNKFWIVVLILTLLISSVSAFQVNTSEKVDVYEKGIFYVEITNPTAELKDLEINFYTPAEIKINAPSKIAPNTNMTAQITVYNNYESYREMNSVLEVKLGDEIEIKQINLRFFAQAGIADNPLMGLFGLGYFVGESANYTMFDWGAFWILIIISAILIIALVARISHRV
jgi:hypothetical protein